MGRTGKATSSTIKGQPDKDTKECVSEDTISKLMKDFTCASLMTTATQSSTKKVQRSSSKESHAAYCEEIVSSLKHFHLKPPVNKRTRLKEKKDSQRRIKSLENKYNLSVAAIHSQTSVLWPGKLNCLSNKKTESSLNLIIRPSRLSIRGITDIKKAPGTSSLSSPIHTSSSEEKARIAASLSGENIPHFNDFNEKNGSTILSFSQLCNGNSKTSNMSNMVLNSQSLPASIKTQAYRNSTTISCKLGHSGKKSVNYNRSFNTSHFSWPIQESSEGNKISSISSSQQLQLHERTLPYNSHYSDSLSSLSSHSVEVDIINNNVTGPANFLSPSTMYQSSISNSLAGANSITPERSCSEEMRMEESNSNVNELASYFEDLLHIPRKMSVMAEMMYA